MHQLSPVFPKEQKGNGDTFGTPYNKMKKIFCDPVVCPKGRIKMENLLEMSN